MHGVIGCIIISARIAEIMELVVEEGCCGRAVSEPRCSTVSGRAHRPAKKIELSCSCDRHDAHRFYARKGMCLSHRRYIKTLK